MQYRSKISRKRPETVLRTIRIPRDMDALLQDDANAKNLPVNTLISSVLRKYAEWDRLAESYGFICIHEDTLVRLLSAVDDAKIIEIATELGERSGKEAPLFWFRDASLEAFLRFLALRTKHTRNSRWDLQTQANECTVLYSHDLGVKWSVFVRHFVCAAAKTLTGASPTCELTERTVLFEFRKEHLDRRLSP